ncbi:MAG: hypothetical protein SFY80_07880 [Verrucomicrobiota bacterium]|nr:hypothetical protein [Verrucomicrobiota bacterium]
MEYDKYIQGLNDIFTKHEFGIQATKDDFNFLERVVIDSIKGGRISKQLTNQICPPIHDSEFYHYTNKVSGESILTTSRLRLYSVEKRIQEDEIRAFLEKFDYKYPLGIDEASQRPRYVQSIADGFYYTSMTDTDLTPNEEHNFWTVFAKGNGFRFRFRLTVQSGCLRRITYGNGIDKWADFFKEVQDWTKNSLNKEFFWEDASSICGLYLPHKYSYERETRLVIKRAWGLDEHSDGNHKYVELKFGYNQSVVTDLQLIEVQTDNQIQAPDGVHKIKRN